jgi:homoserine O-succinyltransferase
LLKEYKRELLRYANGEIAQPPPIPENYFGRSATELARAHLVRVQAAVQGGEPPPQFDDAAFERHLDNTWGDTGKAIVNNWLGLVYQTTNLNRKKLFMSGIDPDK